MSLTNHEYVFVSGESDFYRIHKTIFANIQNAVIEQVYAVWDCIDNRWFAEAPMLVKTSAGILSVTVRSDSYIAIGWNDILLSEKPKWYDNTQDQDIAGLDWVEDLEWREYSKVRQICNEQIESILFHPCSEDRGVGIGFRCRSEKCLWIYDAGDIISAFLT